MKWKLQKCTADRAMERVPLHDREMEISIQYHVMLIHQSNDQILMRCYIIYTVGQVMGPKSKKLAGTAEMYSLEKSK